MRRRTLVVTLVLLAGVLLPLGVFADLKDYILITKPIYHQKTRGARERSGR